MTDDQEKAMAWLRDMAQYRAEYATTIFTMLDELRRTKPEDVPTELLGAMCAAYRNCATGEFGKMRAALQVLRDHYTAPRTKTVEVWRVESAFRGGVRIFQSNSGSKAEADEMAGYLARDGHTCIKVTGPHMQEVPDDQG